ncbi:MAG TPA: zinc-ribbon domain-containing protein [Clostridia bacterium]|nr:zinc-ribbon domain-containing protein [Clostridia bacterium]
MAFCGKCGTQLKNKVKFCPGCGANVRLRSSAPVLAIQLHGETPEQRMASLSSLPALNDVEQRKVMAILAYFSILVLIPLFLARESRFARYHTNQGLILAVGEVVFAIAYGIVNWILNAISWRLGGSLSPVLGLTALVFLVFSIIGIVNAVQGRERELPVIGKIMVLK